MREFKNTPEMMADKFHLGFAHGKNGEFFFSLMMTDFTGKEMCWGAWPMTTWDKMKDMMDEGLRQHKIKQLSSKT